MKDSFSRAERIVVVTGILFIITGVISNEWVLARLFSPDGDLRTNTRIAIWIFDVFMVGLGLSLITFSKKHQLKNLAVLLVTLVMCFTLAEVFLRLIEPKPLMLNLYIENPNGTGSFRLAPDLSTVTKLGSKEIEIKTNSHGMGWREVSVDNPLNKSRIAFVGDSFAFGLWADKMENGTVGVFDSLINTERYEVLNFGIPGYGPPDIELQIREEVMAFKPDYIILMFYNGNDFKDAYLGKDKYNIVDGTAVWDKDNEERKIPEKFRRKVKLWDRLATYRLLNKFISTITTDKGSRSDSDFVVSDEFTSYTFWSRTDHPDVIRKSRDRALSDIDNIRKICYDNNIQFIIVTIPYKEQVFAASPTGANYDISLPQKYIEEYSEKHSTPYLDLLPILRAYVRNENKDIYVPNDIHFNNEGHYVVGKAIADFFKGRFEQ